MGFWNNALKAVLSSLIWGRWSRYKDRNVSEINFNILAKHLLSTKWLSFFFILRAGDSAKEEALSIPFQSKYIHICRFHFSPWVLFSVTRYFFFSSPFPLFFFLFFICSPAVSGLLSAGGERRSEQPQQELCVWTNSPPVPAGPAISSQLLLHFTGSVSCTETPRGGCIPPLT